MSCEENRGRYLRAVCGPGPAGAGAAAALERVFQQARGPAATPLEAADNEAKTRLLFVQFDRGDPPRCPPTHSASGLPRRDAQRGYARLYAQLAGLADQGVLARCPLCGQFGPLAGHSCPAVCTGGGLPFLPSGAPPPIAWAAAAAHRDVLTARLAALEAAEAPGANQTVPERWAGTAKAGQPGSFSWGWDLAVGHDDWSEVRLWNWFCGLDREPTALRPAFERGVRAYRAADPAARVAVYAAGAQDLVGAWRIAQGAWATVAEQAALEQVAVLAAEAPAAAAADLLRLAREPGDRVRRAVAAAVAGRDDSAFAAVQAALAADADPGVQRLLANGAAQQRVATRRAARIRQEHVDVV